MANIKDVAKRAGVSVSAVSRALNNYRDINAETKARILRVAEELRYYPTASARQLVTNLSNTIGVFHPTIDGPGLNQPFIVNLLNEFKITIGSYGYDLMLFANTKAPFDQVNMLERVRHRDVDGVLLLNIPEQAIHQLVHASVPLVAIDSAVHGQRVGSVTSDNRRAEHELVEWLFQEGYRNFGYVHAEMNLPVSIERLQGFYSGMNAVGLTVNTEWVVPGHFSLQGGWNAAERYLQMANMPDVIVCAADIIAVGMMHVFQRAGIRIPDDVSIVGFDDIEAASYVFPQLTTIRQDTKGMGRLAAKTLVALIHDEKLTTPQHFVLPTEIVKRHSTRQLVKLDR